MHKNHCPAVTDIEMFREVVAHLRQERAILRQEWARRIHEAKLLKAMTKEEIFAAATAIYDNYVKVLETGNVKDLQAYAQDLSRRIVHRGVETREVLGIVLLLRDVLARSLFKKYHKSFELLNRVFDAYEPPANRIANTVAVSFVEQRERVIRRQQKAIQILHVQEEERKRISRELHDEVGQALTAMNTQLAAAQRDCPGEQDSLPRARIAEIEKLLIGAMNRVHNFARELRPTVLDDLGLSPALRSYLKEYAERTGLLVSFDRGAENITLDAEQRTALFRIAQECLVNVAKHAQASEVVVTLLHVEKGMQLRIKDNGKGFASEQERSAAKKKRLGLLGMEERARLVNGRLLVQSFPGKGTTVIAEVPLQEGNPSGALAAVSAARGESSRLLESYVRRP
jgi:signal transduction histidine kinase